MHRVLLGLSALVAVTLPAAVAHSQQSTPSLDVRSGGFARSPSFGDFCRGDFRRDGDHRHHRGGGCRTDVVMDWYGGEWALYNNRSWEPDSYNDWWHDRPERAYPRWMTHNQDCARRWYSGDVLTC
jgi:hypothetical protein